MFKIDRDLAVREIADLPLSQGSRRFTNWWLSQIAADGCPVSIENAKRIPGDLAVSTLTGEVRPWATVLCRSSGEVINRALGINLTGRDMLAFVPPSQRKERLARNAKVAAGGILFTYRRLTAQDGTSLQVQELIVPCPDRQSAPLEKSASLILGYLDTSGLASGTRVLVSQGALKLADEPLLIDLRPSSPMAACG